MTRSRAEVQRARELTPPPEADGRGERERIRSGVLYCVAVFAGVRVGLFLLGLVGISLLPHTIHPVSVPGWRAPSFSPGPHNLFTAWERFDALWFLRIAAHGYRATDHSAAFFPLYPLIVRGVSTAIGEHPLAAGILVSNASFLGALVILYFLTSSELSEQAARKTVLYLALFPTALFLFAPYSESTFLLFAVAAFWAARRCRWPLAGAAGALAAATRSFGIFVAPALALEALHQWRRPERDRAPSLPWKLLWSSVAATGTLAYLLFWQVRSGDWLAPVHQQTNWLREASTPWHTLIEGTRDAFGYLGEPLSAYHLVDWLILVPGLILAGYALLRFRPAYSLYTWASILAPLCFIFPGRPLMSMPRFLLPLFPIFWAMADLSERRRLPHHLIVGVSAAGLGLLTVLFVNWYYIF